MLERMIQNFRRHLLLCIEAQHGNFKALFASNLSGKCSYFQSFLFYLPSSDNIKVITILRGVPFLSPCSC